MPRHLYRIIADDVGLGASSSKQYYYAILAPLLLAQDTVAAALALTRFVDARRPLCRGLLVGAGEAIRRDITALAVSAAGTAGAPTPEWLPRDLGIVDGVAATLTILRWWLEQDRSQDAATVAGIIDRLVFRPISWKEA